MRNRGFTLIELLVVIVIIGILVAIALPNFIKVQDKAKEAQSKAAMRVIIMAVERYGTDWGGKYPLVLSGGDPSYNNFRMYPGNFYSGNMRPVETAFIDNVNNNNGQQQSPDGRTDLGFCATTMAPPAGDPYGTLPVCMDSLMLNGYLTSYPKNPFHVASKVSCYGQQGTCNSYFSWAGEYGNQMFDISNSRGDWPWVGLWANEYTNNEYSDFYNNQLPGHFYYHPIFMDSLSARDHRVALADAGSAPAQQIIGHAVAGYTMSVVAGLTSGGQDVTHMSPCWFDDPTDLSFQYCWWNGAGGYFWQPTGYFSFEDDPRPAAAQGSGPSASPNPWVGGLPPGDENPSGSGPDGNKDFLATTVSSGTDSKIKTGY